MEIGYAPQYDYYKTMRDAIVKLHMNDLQKHELDRLVGSVPKGKVKNYEEMLVGYKKFMGTKKTKWFNPSKKGWDFGGEHQIAVNPELGLEINKEKYLVKLYFKSDKPSKDRCAGVLSLMKHVLMVKNARYALLDVRNGKLYTYSDDMDRMLTLVEAEAIALSAILEKI